ncbi:ATP phosphoribosyltransferase regulatory subunit [Campylobacter geochelonis]|uniref:ATP phosphoribosyltransferase regulatory subunit n=1 Tax=Campylobacter geochelonis TaxID=1780362 RepID=A0A128EL45_9BACT|nr:ATP phosphoribosyltransferase regulatory subunit [Campylobacter geochelonis]QKF71989.1 ATP phosphoribosyltransferase HisG(S)Z, hetero-octameric short form, regulatory subunit [Campylobacter geochelonis]CZE47733.1 ATP phosphoribosyltransferase regulatory subunit [Campylobacter geochelonis]CZE48963.1 ATP phosphoribosyltransferase regulatory subunit [Campylobacter geochelonis]CZE49927.1 ATP phosphoribosyltransferase regulatory subunit [Campylobacter geochelonis]
MDSVRADLEHEIPNGSRLYFGKTASIKREIENYAATLFKEYGFEEILTPYFSYHQHLSVSSEQLLKFPDMTNHTISLRADSTVDVVRIVLRRIKNENLKRLFYIQPVLKYPNIENYQIGAELIGESNLALSIEIASKVFDKFGLKPNLQISNIEIPKLVCQILNTSISGFEKGDMEWIFKKDIKWLSSLARLTHLKDLEDVKKIVPNELKAPLERLENLAHSSNENIRLAPLYYSKMRYYDKLFFRFLCDNYVLCSGGDYEIDSLESSGFAIMTDAFLENILER